MLLILHFLCKVSQSLLQVAVCYARGCEMVLIHISMMSLFLFCCSDDRGGNLATCLNYITSQIHSHVIEFSHLLYPELFGCGVLFIHCTV